MLTHSIVRFQMWRHQKIDISNAVLICSRQFIIVSIALLGFFTVSILVLTRSRKFVTVSIPLLTFSIICVCKQILNWTVLFGESDRGGVENQYSSGKKLKKLKAYCVIYINFSVRKDTWILEQKNYVVKFENWRVEDTYKCHENNCSS